MATNSVYVQILKCVHSSFKLLSGASPVRRDFGRGLTPAQWARLTSRHLCADAIDKFVRTAVPGGEELAKQDPPLSSSSRSARSNAGGAKPPLSLVGRILSSRRRRSQSAGPRDQHQSWITRKLKNAFSSPSKDVEKTFSSNTDKRSVPVPTVKVTKDDMVAYLEEELDGVNSDAGGGANGRRSSVVILSSEGGKKSSKKKKSS